MSLHIYVSQLLDRRLLVIEDVVALPIDRITHIDLNAPNGGCNNSVRIHTDNPDEDYTFAYENADAVREFLQQNASGSRQLICKRTNCQEQITVNGAEMPDDWTRCRCRDCGCIMTGHVCPDHARSSDEFLCKRCGSD